MSPSVEFAASLERAQPIQLFQLEKQAVRNLCARLAQEYIKDDFNKSMELIPRMNDEDNESQVRFKADQDGRIEAMLWCTGENQNDLKII